MLVEDGLAGVGVELGPVGEVDLIGCLDDTHLCAVADTDSGDDLVGQAVEELFSVLWRDRRHHFA